MTSDHYTKVGSIVKFHGLKGAVKTTLSNYLKNTEDIRCFFIPEGDGYIPYFVEQLSPLPPKFYFVKFEDVDSREAAMLLAGAGLYLEKKELEKHLEVVSVEGPFVHLIGFRLFDQTDTEIATIEDIVDLPHHWLAQVFIDGKEVLIPMNDEVILETRMEEKEVKIEISEGLIDLYIS